MRGGTHAARKGGGEAQAHHRKKKGVSMIRKTKKGLLILVLGKRRGQSSKKKENGGRTDPPRPHSVTKQEKRSIAEFRTKPWKGWRVNLVGVSEGNAFSPQEKGSRAPCP